MNKQESKISSIAKQPVSQFTFLSSGLELGVENKRISDIFLKKINKQMLKISIHIQPTNDLAKKIDKILEPLKIFFGVLHTIFKQIDVILEKFKKYEPYLEKIRVESDNPEFSILIESISLSDVFDSIDLDSDPNQFSILKIISSTGFQESLLETYSKLSLSFERKKIIEEALLLHNSKFYYGSICLLYSQIEGVFSEYLVKSGHVAFEKKRYFYVDASKKKNEIKGLRDKFNVVEENTISLTNDIQSLKNLTSFLLAPNNDESAIVKARNLALHGGISDFNEKRSGQLILWLFSLLIHIQALQAKKINKAG